MGLLPGLQQRAAFIVPQGRQGRIELLAIKLAVACQYAVSILCQKVECQVRAGVGVLWIAASV